MLTLFKKNKCSFLQQLQKRRLIQIRVNILRYTSIIITSTWNWSIIRANLLLIRVKWNYSTWTERSCATGMKRSRTCESMVRFKITAKANNVGGRRRMKYLACAGKQPRAHGGYWEGTSCLVQGITRMWAYSLAPLSGRVYITGSTIRSYVGFGIQ